jgi:hypothetical protein
LAPVETLTPRQCAESHGNFRRKTPRDISRTACGQ